MKVPWKALIALAPTIVTTATKIWREWNGDGEPARLRRSSPKDLSLLARRVEALESAEKTQAELVKQMADQMQTMTDALLILRRRAALGIGVATLAGVIAIAALVLAAR